MERHARDTDGCRRVLVCGGRNFGDGGNMPARLLMRDTLDRLENVGVIIEGGARGADRFAAGWAQLAGVKLETYPANWERDGRSAGPIRNQRMIDEGKPDLVVAFHGGRGTADMVRRARAAGIEVIEVPSLSGSLG